MRNQKVLLVLFLLLSAGLVWATKVVPLPDVVNPGTFTVDLDGKQLYITEGINVYIYSLPELKFLKKFGKRGEGPKEFLPPFGGQIRLDSQKDQFMVISAFKLSFFEKDGAYKNEVKAPPRLLTNRYIRDMGKHYIASTLKPGTKEEKNRLMIAYTIYDKKFQEVNAVRRVMQDYQGVQSGVGFNPLTWYLFGPAIYYYDNKIFLCHYGSEDSNFIYVYDNAGKKLYDIPLKHNLLPFNAKEQNRFKASFVSDQDKQMYAVHKNLFQFPDHFPGRQSFIVTDNKIYVQTFNRKGEEKDEKCLFLIMDLKGKLLKKVWLPFQFINPYMPYLYTISNGKLYQGIEDDEEEEWAMHITDINQIKGVNE